MRFLCKLTTLGVFGKPFRINTYEVLARDGT